MSLGRGKGDVLLFKAVLSRREKKAERVSVVGEREPE